MRRLTRTVPAPSGLGVEVIGVPEGTEVDLALRLESVMEGVLVTGTARAPLEGECVRCLEPLHQQFETEFQELYVYPSADRGQQSDGDDDEETPTLEAETFDLEPVLRDAVVLALPLQPVCQDDCPGLCPQCGARLADDPDHQHEAVDPRWAALKDLAVPSGAGEPDGPIDAARGADENQEK